jgi:glucose/arabinose dehydrogenase
VLVAETSSPPREMGGIEGFIAKLLFSRAGAAVPSANRISLLRDADGDGVAEAKSTLLTEGLDSPSGMAWRDGVLFVANHDELLAFPMPEGATEITEEPTKLMDLPAAGNHWMRNVLLSPDGSKVYVAVGSASNIGENGMEVEEGRATIWEYNLETNRQRMWAGGLRNPNGMDWNPASGEMWTVVNERDMLGGDLVPDYLTNVPVGAQYGWPWLYWGDNVDSRVDAPRPRSARTPPRWEWFSRAAGSGWAPAMPTALSSRATARGTASRPPGTTWSSCRSTSAATLWASRSKSSPGS